MTLPHDPGADYTSWFPERALTFQVLALRHEVDGEWRCRYCRVLLRRPHEPEGLPHPTLDHVLPRSRGGSDRLANLVVACGGCNSRKGARLLDELPPGWHLWRTRAILHAEGIDLDLVRTDSIGVIA